MTAPRPRHAPSPVPLRSPSRSPCRAGPSKCDRNWCAAPLRPLTWAPSTMRVTGWRTLPLCGAPGHKIRSQERVARVGRKPLGGDADSGSDHRHTRHRRARHNSAGQATHTTQTAQLWVPAHASLASRICGATAIALQLRGEEREVTCGDTRNSKVRVTTRQTESCTTGCTVPRGTTYVFEDFTFI